MNNEDRDTVSFDSASLSDETIRKCLLGSAAPVEQKKFEELLLLNDELEERVRRAELELADDYSFERLEANQRKLFENGFLVTAERERMLSVSRALRRSLSPGSETKFGSEHTWPRFRSPAVFLIRNPLGKFVVAGLALLLFGIIVGLFLKSPQTRRPEIVKKPPAGTPEREFAHPVSSPPQAVATPEISSEAPIVATVTLKTDGKLEEQEVQLKSALNARDLVRLVLLLPYHQDAEHNAELLTATGVQIATASNLRTGAEPGRVDWDLSAKELKPGDYTIRLTRVRESQVFAVYTYLLRVR